MTISTNIPHQYVLIVQINLNTILNAQYVDRQNIKYGQMMLKNMALSFIKYDLTFLDIK